MSGVALGSAAIGLFGSYAGSQNWWQGDDDDQEPQYKQPPAPKFIEEPRFPETDAARQSWWDKIQQWGNMPGYGAIGPDWGDIWERVKERIGYQYWGGPGGQPGLAAKVRASAAARGVSESPALETELSRMGMQEASDVRGAATEQAIQEAMFGEKGRQNWLTNVAKISGLRVPGTWQGATMYTPPEDTSMSDLGGAVGNYLGGMGEQDFYKQALQEYYGKNQLPGTAQTSIKSDAYEPDEYVSAYKKRYPASSFMGS